MVYSKLEKKNWQTMGYSQKVGLTQLSDAKIPIGAEETLEIKSNESNHAVIVPKVPFTRKQKICLCLLAYVEFIRYCATSIIPPFFPQLAESKGMSETVSGLLFSFYGLVMVIFSPIFGKLIPIVGVKFIFSAGVLITGICTIVFACLEYINDYTTFTIVSFSIRAVEGIGASAYATACYVIISNKFQDCAATIRGVMEIFVGIGMSVGSIVGGLLFSVGGFGFPFYVFGVCTIIITPFNILMLDAEGGLAVGKSSSSLVSLLKLPATLVVCGIITVSSLTWGFLDPTLEPAMRKFHLTPSNIGVIFFIFSTSYSVICPLCGWLADRMRNYWILMVGGLVLSCFSLFLLGPSPMLTFLEDSVWLKIISLCLLGASFGVSLIPTFQGLLDSAIEGGHADDLGTHSTVSGLWTSVFSLGEIAGPALGGALLEHVGFASTTTVMVVLNIFTAVGAGVYFSFKRKATVAYGDEVVEKN